MVFESKAFFVSGVLPLTNLNLYPYAHPQYPILFPLIVDLIYHLIGGVREIPVFLTYPFFYLVILLLAYKMFRKLGIGETTSLVITYVYSMLSPLLAMAGRKHAGETDIFITLINWGIVHFVFNYLKDKKMKWLVLTSVLIMIGSQIKIEGAIPVVVFLFIPLAINRKALFIFLSLLPAAIWNFVVRRVGLVADFGWMLPSFLEIIKRIGEVFYYVTLEMLNVRNWYIFWPLFWISIFINKKKNKFIGKIIIPSILSMGLLFLLNYVGSTISPAEYVPSSIDRIFIQFSPFILPIFRVKIDNRKLFRLLSRKMA